MKIETFTVGPLEANCYLITQGKTAVLIDPGVLTESLEKRLRALEKDVDLILLTHGHIDHIGGAAQLKALTGALVMIHAQDAPKLSNAAQSLASKLDVPQTPLQPDRILEDGDIAEAGGLRFRVLHTPGHSEGSVCYLAGDCLFSGDTLFYESVGRTDLQRDGDEWLAKSLTRLCGLPDACVVYPGHGPKTTLAYEKRFNPYLRFYL